MISFCKQSEISDKPYKGLNPYSEEDDKLFFGREIQVENIIDRLTTSRLTILYGDSGVGKTSVVRAGVAAQLRQQSRKNLSEYQAPLHAVVVFPPFDLSWKDEPLFELKNCIEREIRELVPNVRSPGSELSFIKTLQVWTELLGGEEGGGELFIILDQFEEYFLYHHSSKAIERTFAFEFPRAVTRSRLRVNFLLSLRKDSIAELDYFKGRLLNLLNNRMELGHLDWNSATEAIKQPIYKYYNEEVSPEEPSDIEEQLIEQVLQQVSQNNNHNHSNHNHSGRVEAPYLQLVMERLWEEEQKKGSRCLRLQTFEHLEGVAGIAEEHLNQKMKKLSENKRDIEIAASVFHYLVTPSGGKKAYSAFDLAELANQARRDCDHSQLVTKDELDLWLDKLTQWEFRLLSPVGKSPNLSYEIFHDVLAQPILDWLAKYWKEKEEKRAELEAERIKQEANKIAEKEIEDARQEAQQKIQQAQSEAKRWGIGGSIAAVFCLALGISGAFWIGRKTEVLGNVGDLRANYHIRARNLRGSTTELKKLNQEYLPLLIRAGSQLQRQEWILQSLLDSAYSTQKVGLMRLLASILDYVQGPFPETIMISQGEGKPVWASSFSSDGKLLATGSEDGTIRIWDLQVDTPRATTISQGEGKSVWASTFSPDGKLLATGSANGEIRLWDLQVDTPQAITISPSEGKSILTMSFSPDGKLLATGSANGKIRLWDLQLNPPREKIIPRKSQEDSNAVIDMSFNSNGKRLATASGNGVVSFWDLENQPNEQSPIIPVISPRECLLTISFDRHGRQIALVSGKREKKNSPGDRGSKCRQEKISLFDRQVKRIYDYSTEQDSQITRIDFSPDGKLLATFSRDGSVEILPIYTFNELLDQGRTWVCTHSDNYNSQAIEDLSCPNQNNSS